MHYLTNNNFYARCQGYPASFHMKAKDRELRVGHSLEFTRSDALIFEPPFPVWKMPRLSTLGLVPPCEGKDRRGCRIEVLRGGPLEHTRRAGLPGRKDRKREAGKKEENPRTSRLATLPAARARHINSNGKRIKSPHFLTRCPVPGARSPEPLIFAEREKFSAYFRGRRSSQIYRT